MGRIPFLLVPILKASLGARFCVAVQPSLLPGPWGGGALLPPRSAQEASLTAHTSQVRAPLSVPAPDVAISCSSSECGSLPRTAGLFGCRAPSRCSGNSSEPFCTSAFWSALSRETSGHLLRLLDSGKAHCVDMGALVLSVRADPFPPVLCSWPGALASVSGGWCGSFCVV